MKIRGQYGLYKVNYVSDFGEAKAGQRYHFMKVAKQISFFGFKFFWPVHSFAYPELTPQYAKSAHQALDDFKKAVLDYELRHAAECDTETLEREIHQLDD